MELEQQLDDDNEDLREAVFGKTRVGLPGLVSAVSDQHADLKRERDARHADLTRERDARLAADKQIWVAVKHNTRRIDRMVWIAIGAGAGGASGGAFLGTLLGG